MRGNTKVGWDSNFNHWPYPEGTPELVRAMVFARAYAERCRGGESSSTEDMSVADCWHPDQHRDHWQPHPSTGRSVCQVCHETPEVRR
jgi:hypothetical protein